MTSRLLRAGALGLVTALSAVGSLASVSAEPFRLGVQTDALTLDPIASSDNPSIWTELLVFDQLVRPSKDGTKLEPGLAEKWTVSPGRQGIYLLRCATQICQRRAGNRRRRRHLLKRAAGEKHGSGALLQDRSPGTRRSMIKTIMLKLDKPFTPLLNNLGAVQRLHPANKRCSQVKGALLRPSFRCGPFVVKPWNQGEKIVWRKESQLLAGRQARLIR